MRPCDATHRFSRRRSSAFARRLRRTCPRCAQGTNAPSSAEAMEGFAGGFREARLQAPHAELGMIRQSAAGAALSAEGLSPVSGRERYSPSPDSGQVQSRFRTRRCLRGHALPYQCGRSRLRPPNQVQSLGQQCRGTVPGLGLRRARPRAPERECLPIHLISISSGHYQVKYKIKRIVILSLARCEIEIVAILSLAQCCDGKSGEGSGGPRH